jgi:hypothetical protein
VNVAPELPPPPYTSLMTTSGETADAGAARARPETAREPTTTPSTATRGFLDVDTDLLGRFVGGPVRARGT